MSKQKSLQEKKTLQGEDACMGLDLKGNIW